MADKIKGLRTVMYFVEDIQAAKEWYSKVFQTVPYFDEVFYVGLNIGGYELGLHPADKPIKGDNILTYWGVDDVGVTLERVVSLGGILHEAANNVGGEIVVGSVYDPWRNIIGFIYNPEFKAE